MFSFFKSSKKSPVVSPTHESKEDENKQKAADDFVLIGGGQNRNSMPLYPPISSGGPVAPVPSAAPHHAPFERQYSMQIANYTQNVPFKLNPALCSNDDTDFLEFQLKEISQTISKMSSSVDYDFKLERAIIDQN
ncbi:CLUMA_CG004510, isoform A [Clunio marinus]|uniref:CLUMA_CG004510, isoform A n=1 Tax=Clunio marinus TaxID=568069 RepID=A0A1J1HTX3_9DIPT|nr:CLUMA_CG004510, isoform A [Clunio marinus]